MSQERNNPARPPTPEQLAAYTDGETSPADAEAMEAWLRDHPAAAAEVRALRNLAGLWQEHSAAEPAPAAWDRTLHGIEAGVRAPRRVPRSGTPRLRLGLSVAAACLAALLVARSFWPTPANTPVRPGGEGDDEPYPVATQDEITIVSMDPRDSRFLVVGLPPITGDMEWATPDDVTLVEATPNDGGQKPEMRTGGTVPVILPTATWGGKED